MKVNRRSVTKRLEDFQGLEREIMYSGLGSPMDQSEGDKPNRKYSPFPSPIAN